ncbi:cytochrome C [Sphingomonas spermidinifaciens]|uniref:Cytochrome C n=1 Tax=Sphingomonas spermidinifaciens TaxID=1141889 RepID=A0A2A4B1T5_9SPHN|nr:c-type cytochrome [Sphingomonas spermidinifaciens]PCD03153.1 cytochrome C [Sphingomonas spermidinifaciens]
MTIRITWKRVLLALLAIFAAGMAFAWSGLFQVAASSGHWKVTEWFLHWVMRNSVKTYSALQTPEVVRDDRGLVSAAGHFKQACASCHGAPGQRPNPVMQKATPPAPDLTVNARQWTDRQLFWILEHGVKYSGMPAWGAEKRPDEVRRMVAFVRRLPTMTTAQYRALTETTTVPPVTGLRPGLIESCAGCHGVDGRGRGPDVPVLAGQKVAYLEGALRRYAAGHRASAVMRVAAAALSPMEMRVLARHYAAMPGLRDVALPATHPILTEGRRDDQLPACASCHAPNKAYPLIAGQKATYVADRLTHWRGDEKIVDARKPSATMPVIARRIPEEQIEPLARALAGAE